MILLRWLVVGITAWPAAATRTIRATPRPESDATGKSHPGKKSDVQAETRPMRPLTFAGAVLTGLGAVVLLHGGRITAGREPADIMSAAATTAQPPGMAPRLGGLVMAAGIALAGVAGRRQPS